MFEVQLHPIIRFYMGEKTFCDQLGFSPESCLIAGNDWWEGCHNHIQWLFPLREPSNFNPNAPLVTDAVIAAFHEYDCLHKALNESYERFRSFLAETRSNWVKPNDHNLLRITRAIKSLDMLGCPIAAYDILHCARNWAEDVVGDTTLKFWVEAYYPRGGFGKAS